MSEFIAGRVSESGVLTPLQIWLAAFPALQILCIDTFLSKHEATLSEPYCLFVRLMEVAIDPMITAIDIRLAELRAAKRN